MKRISLKVVSVICFIVICCSLFLPQYETLTDGMLDDSFSYMSQYPNPDQSGGFFGGGYYTTFNGFGSFMSILNVLISFFLMIMLLIDRISRKNLVSLFIFMIVVHLLSFSEVLFAPVLLSEPIRLKVGFYFLRIMEMALFYFAFAKIEYLHKTKIERADLIDN